ncbi:cytochrome c biogenesis protein ResB [uncultured Lutibacter sp.]|uniref:cytochrome c biogenesis protein ResB n=1 Tax=uncultured Lutibacter sp. TaxID=437739 RepID=UPI00262C242F|nr:cytochrome c biogenesis protein ResB [uncultured Lutibacter sp.]
MSENNIKIQRNLWENPWGYIESFFIGIGLIITGLFLEVFSTSNNVFTLSYPYNVIFLIGYIVVLFVLYKWFTNSQIIRWLTKVPASISSIVLVTVLVMIMGIIPQIPSENKIINNLGLNHITSNWAFLLILFQFLTCLGLISIKRILQFKWSNFGFVLNHTGLFLALTAGVLGTGDLQRLSINVYEGKPSWVATDQQKKEIELPFAFFLKDFLIDEYNPKLALVDNKTGSIAHNDGKNLYLVEKGETYYFNNFEVKIDNFLSNAIRFGMRYEAVNEIGSPPAAKVTVKNIENDSIKTAWISSGSFRYPYESLKISKEYSVVMTIPEVKKFSSDIDILTKEGERISTVLEVNKPFKYKGWKIYQLSYDDKMGKWSNLSVLELVKDPWLPLIYIGIFMMIAGAIYMFWMGNKITKNQE